jgi:hypothetical protein
MMDAFAAAPQPAHRLIPSRFPRIGQFDTVATAADLAAVMEPVGWTNDRLVADRIDRLPQRRPARGSVLEAKQKCSARSEHAGRDPQASS